MIVIYGESQSGKTSKALSLLSRESKSIYFVLDHDTSLDRWLKYRMNTKIDIREINRNFEYDIEYDIEFGIFERGVINKNLSQLVVDPINYLVRKNKNSLKDVIEKLKSIEDRYNIDVIVTMNTSFYLEEIENLKNCVLIKSKKTDKVKKSWNVSDRMRHQFVGLSG